MNLPGYEQIIFAWTLATNEQRRRPRERVSKTQLPNAEITAYNNLGCVVYIDAKRAEFAWYESDRDEPPQHKGRLVNFADWEYSEQFQHNTATAQYRQPSYTGHYSEPQPYEAEE